MTDEEKKSKIITDEGWKKQAQSEKEKLGKKTQPDQPGESAPSSQAQPGPAGPLPPPDFLTLINSFMLQALYSLGRLGDPNQQKSPVNLELAKHHIDMLQLIEDKTKGNLNDEEKKAMAVALHEIRMQYVQAAST